MIRDKVEEKIEELFVELAKDYKLPSGDIDVHQTLRLDKAYETGLCSPKGRNHD